MAIPTSISAVVRGASTTFWGVCGVVLELFGNAQNEGCLGEANNRYVNVEMSV